MGMQTDGYFEIILNIRSAKPLRESGPGGTRFADY
jgi:hypothetical protein